MPEYSLEEIRQYIDKRLKQKDVDFDFYSEYGRYMSKKQIDRAIDIGIDLWVLYKYVGENFTSEQIDRAMEKGEYLGVLYEFVGESFTSEQIDRAMEIAKNLAALYKYTGKKFTSEQIDKALEIGKDLWDLYAYVGHKFTLEQVEKAIEISYIDELNILSNILREKNPELFERSELLEAIKQYKTKQVIEQYPKAEYFDPKTYKVDKFIDALKIIRQDMLEGR